MGTMSTVTLPELGQFQMNFDHFRPAVSECPATKKMNNTVVRSLHETVRMKVHTHTPEQALIFLDELVDKMNKPESLAELVNEPPLTAFEGGSAFHQYDSSRMNFKLDMLLLEVVESFHKGLAQIDDTRKAAYEQLQSKLKIISSLREHMWKYDQVQRGLMQVEGLYDNDGKDCVRALVRILLKLRMHNYHKRQNQVCREQHHNGHATGYFKPHISIKDFVYECCDMHTNKELFDLLMSSGEANINTIIHHLTENNSLLEFPVVRATRGWYSFTNGVYSADHDTFWPYSDTSRPHVCTVNFINHEFHKTMEADWRDIRTPALSKILDSQQLTPDIIEWVWVLLGRTLFAVSHHDRWEVVPFFQGIAGSGKSTIVEGLFTYLYDQASTFIISNNLEQQFGLQDALGPDSPFMVCCGSEIGKDFKLDQKQFQKMCSGERLSVAVKNGKAIQDVWTLPTIMAGNQAPSYSDDSGSMARRLAMIRFTVPLTEQQKDPQLFQKIGQEMPQILQKMAKAYKERVDNGDTRRDFWKVAATAFRDSRAELKAATNPLEDFAQSGQLVFHPDAYMKLSELRELAKRFAGSRSISLTTDSFKDVFHPRGVTFPPKGKKIDTRTAKMSSTCWAVGCRTTTMDDMEED